MELLTNHGIKCLWTKLEGQHQNSKWSWYTIQWLKRWSSTSVLYFTLGKTVWLCVNGWEQPVQGLAGRSSVVYTCGQIIMCVSIPYSCCVLIHGQKHLFSSSLKWKTAFWPGKRERMVLVCSLDLILLLSIQQLMPIIENL